MTPRELEVLNVLEKYGLLRISQVAKKIVRSVGYSRNLLDYLTRAGQVEKMSRDTYQITSKGIDAMVSEYLHTLNGLERRIDRHLTDQQRLVEEIDRLSLRKNNRQEYRIP